MKRQLSPPISKPPSRLPWHEVAVNVLSAEQTFLGSPCSGVSVARPFEFEGVPA